MNISGGRDMIMLFGAEGVNATDVDGIRNMGLDLGQVANLIARTFCHQCFHTGFVHCDPHAANILVRPQPSGKAFSTSKTLKRSNIMLTNQTVVPPGRFPSPGVDGQKGLRLQFNSRRLSTLVYHSAHSISNIRRIFPVDRLPHGWPPVDSGACH
eukprot:2834290-Pyramimonas_sp.AAC.3